MFQLFFTSFFALLFLCCESYALPPASPGGGGGSGVVLAQNQTASVGGFRRKFLPSSVSFLPSFLTSLLCLLFRPFLATASELTPFLPLLFKATGPGGYSGSICFSRGIPINPQDCIGLGTDMRHRHYGEIATFLPRAGKVFYERARPNCEFRIWNPSIRGQEVEIGFGEMLLKAMMLAGKCRSFGGQVEVRGLEFRVQNPGVGGGELES